MASEILFEEIQGTTNKKYSDFFWVTSGIFLVVLIVNLCLQKGRINNLTFALFTGLVLLIIAAIFCGFRMVTQIRKDGIYVRYPPFQPRRVYFPWSDIRQVYLRKYNALPEYNGWGMKLGVSGRCYTAGGDTGLQLQLNDGTLILIGTKMPEHIQQVLISIQK
ncbi:MAG: hypothetical protein ACM3VS_06280 [Candidatus Dadabacteria bacterium]